MPRGWERALAQLCAPTGQHSPDLSLGSPLEGRGWGLRARQGPPYPFQARSTGGGRRRGEGQLTKLAPASPSVKFSPDVTYFAKPIPHLLEGFPRFSLSQLWRSRTRAWRLSFCSRGAALCSCGLQRKAELAPRGPGLAGAPRCENQRGVSRGRSTARSEGSGLPAQAGTWSSPDSEGGMESAVSCHQAVTMPLLPTLPSLGHYCPGHFTSGTSPYLTLSGGFLQAPSTVPTILCHLVLTPSSLPPPPKCKSRETGGFVSPTHHCSSGTWNILGPQPVHATSLPRDRNKL